jgi:2-hydroxycyclohexanecarboxyl-CoA dehydrogenase
VLPETTLPPPKTLAESRALIVGGTAGVGLASVRRLVVSGVQQVVIVGRGEKRGLEALSSLADLDASVEFMSGDAGDASEATRIVQEAHKTLGGIDIMVCSVAPEVHLNYLHRYPIGQVAPTLTQIALPPMHMTRAVLPHMRDQQGGVIINVASDAGKVATPGESVAGAAMAAIVMFTRTVALEAKRWGVRANVLTPSLIANTASTERICRDQFLSKLFTDVAGHAQLGVAEAEDLAAMVAFLASPDARRLTGQAISVNGGISAA